MKESTNNGKGSRPRGGYNKQYRDNFDAIFKKVDPADTIFGRRITEQEMWEGMGFKSREDAEHWDKTVGERVREDFKKTPAQKAKDLAERKVASEAIDNFCKSSKEMIEKEMGKTFKEMREDLL